MIEYLYSIDVSIFFFINHSIANPVLDVIMPFLTDLNHNKIVQLLIIFWVLFVVWKGGIKGRSAIGLLIVTIIISDQMNSMILKDVFGRIRPCRALEGVRLLVDCGGGLSFPSSHAVNNFAGATVISHIYKKQKLYWFIFAGVVAFSRPYVGVHYPSDIVAGSIIGFGIGIGITFFWEKTKSFYKNKIQNSQE